MYEALTTSRGLAEVWTQDQTLEAQLGVVTEFYRFCNYNWAIFLLSLKQYCEEGKGINFQGRKF